MEPSASAVEAQNLNHWTVRKFPSPVFKGEKKKPKQKTCSAVIKLEEENLKTSVVTLRISHLQSQETTQGNQF